MDHAPDRRTLYVVPLSASADDRWRLRGRYAEDAWSEYLGPASRLLVDRPAKEKPALKRKARASRPRPKQATVGQSVTRKVDSSGYVSFAGHGYRISKKHCRRQVQVAIVGDTVEISAGGELLKVHPIRHDRSRENGAFANAGGRPSRINAA